MIDINKLLGSKRVEVSFPETAVDGAYVKLFRADHRLTQAALANIMGVKKKTIEKWEQGVNKVSGSSAVLLKLLRDDPELIGRLYKVQAVSGKTETDDYTPIDRKVINGTVKTAAKVRRNIWAAVFLRRTGMECRDCMLQMDELYFSSFDFEQSREDSNTEYDVSFHIEYAKNKKDSAKFRVMIRTAVENKTGSVRIRLDTVGIFTIENFELDRDLNERILKANTVAIMFPYIRSQISLLTTQPGLHPVMLPPMNINALLDSTEEA